MRYILMFSFLSAACSGPAFTSEPSEAFDLGVASSDPQTDQLIPVSDPQTQDVLVDSDPQTAAVQSAAAPVPSPSAPTTPQPQPSGIIAPQAEPVLEYAPTSPSMPVIEYPVVSCTLGEADRGAGPRVMHAECPDTAPYCQRHGVCGVEEYEAPECTAPGYSDPACEEFCSVYRVCAKG